MTRPTYATAPTPGAEHDLAAVQDVAGMLGTKLMPWQSQVTRVATERLPNGRWRYPIVIVTVPRQSGKTTLMRAVLVQRAIMRRRLLAFYTAQTGKDATARWNDLVSAVDESPLGPLTVKRLSAGSQALTFPNGSSVAPFAPTPKSLHGYTPPLVMVDEAFAFDDAQGTALEGAIRPAQITLPDRQWWIVSTAGTADSTWFRRWIDLGRDSTNDPGAGVAYFEWSLADGLDPYDPEAWATFHPALGHTQEVEALAADSQSTPPGEWERAYCNRWTTTAQAVIPIDAWDSLGRRPDQLAQPPAGRTVALGYDVAQDRSEAALIAAWIDADGRAVGKTIQTGAGLDWLPSATIQARNVLGDRAKVCAPDTGPARQVTDALTRDGHQVVTVGGRDWATACGAVLWRATSDQLRHDQDPALRRAVQVVQTRPTGDAWAFSRQASAGSIAALTALTVAVRVADHVPAAPAPMIVGAA